MLRLNTLGTIGAAAAATVVFIPAQADALVITQTLNFAPTIVSYSGLSATPTYKLFDTNLGTLTSITITTTVSGTTSGTVTNTAGVNGRLGASFAGAQFSLDSTYTPVQNLLATYYGLGLTNNFSVINLVDTSQFSSTTKQGATIPTNGSFSFSFTNSGTATSTLTSNSDLSALSFNGTKLDTLTADFTGNSGASNSAGTFSGSVTTTDGGSVTIVYNYDAPPPPPPPTGTPEPASMAMLGMGLVGLGAAIRRRRRT